MKKDPELLYRQFDFQKDYWEVCEWWRTHKWPFIPTHALSDNGVIIYDKDGTKYCCGWLYRMDCSVGMLEWVVTNPKSPIMNRKPSLELLVRCVLAAAKNVGMTSVYSSLKNKNLVKLFSSNGFEVTEEKMTNMIARVSV